MTDENTILVVGEDPLYLSETAGLLRDAGYQVLEAQSGEQALTIAREHKPDLMLLDIVMPDINGIEVCRQLKSDKDTSGIFVSMISEQTAEVLEEAEGLEAGADDYIMRPLSNPELRVRVGMMLRLIKAEKELKKQHNHLESLVQQSSRALQSEKDKHRVTEKTLRENEEKYRSMMEAMTHPAYICSNDFRIAYMNSAMEKRISKDAIGKACYAAIHNFEEICSWCKYSEIKSGNKVELEVKSPKDNRTYIVSSSPIYETDGSVSMMNIFTDITDRKLSEERLFESSKRIEFLAGIIEKTQQPIGIGYPDGRLGFCNQAFCNLTGYTVDELKTMDWANALTPPEWLPSEMQALSELEQTGNPVQYEKEYIRKNGERVPIEMLVHVARGESGETKYYYAFITNINERKKVEDTLRESEEKYRKLVNTAPFGIQLTDLDGKILFSNPAHNRIQGYGEGELVGKYVWDFAASDEDRKNTQVYYQEIIKLQPSPETHYSIDRSQDGRLINIQVDWDYIYDTDGELAAIISIISDVTERKQAEKKLNDILHFNEKIISNSPVGISIYQSDSGQCIATNDAMAELIGATQEQILSQNFYKISSWHDTGILQAALEALKENKKVRHSADLITTFGKKRVIDCHFSPFIFEETSHLMLTAADITRRVEAEKAIIEQKENAERYLNLAGVIFVALNRKGEVTLINQKGCEALGYRSSEIIGKNWFENFIPKWLLSELLPVSKQLLNGDIEPVEYYENPILAKNGEEKLIAWHNTILKDKTGKIIGHLSAGEDITDKRQLENQLQQSQKMESVGTLAGGIAHEFNNILSIIIGNNELVMEDLPQWSLSRESCEEIRLAGIRARDIVKHLLTFSRQDDSTKKPIDIVSVTMEALKLIRATTPSNIEIRDKISPDCLTVFGDSTQIHQILINLCNNAVDALPISGGIIDIELSNKEFAKKDDVASNGGLPSGKYIRLLVRDNGSGMDAVTIERAFEPYFTTKDVGEGSGIGLAVVHGIVENHGGSIVCESTEGEGTIFTILLPVHEGVVEEQQDHKSVSPGRGERILYVDDEPSIAKLGKRHLEALGYDAFSTTDPQEALEMIKAEPDRFNLVVSDMAMPHMPGDQLITEILNINPKMLTMICSGYSSRMSDTKASEMGIKAFVMKPLNKNELAKKVRELLDSSIES